MINILVVDDEPIIVNSLYQLLCQTAEWPLNVYKASSASQALEIVANTRIDVMLSDICMPGLDGLELQRRVQQEWPSCQVIFLTGYDSFEYAQKAIRQSSAGYVLKVEGDEAILGTLRRVIGQIERERENQKLLKRMQSALPLLRREFIGELLLSRKYAPEELSELMASMDFPLRHDEPVLLLLTFTHPASGVEEQSSLSGLFGVISIISEYLEGRVRMISVPQPPDTVITLYQPEECDSSEHWPAAYRRVRETLEEIQESSQRMLGLFTSHVIASESCEWNDLAVKRKHLDETVGLYGFDYRNIITDEAIAHDASRKQKSEPQDSLIPSPHQLAQLRLMLSNNDEEGMTALLHEFLAGLRSVEVPFSAAKEIYYSLALVFLRSLNDMGSENIHWRADPELLTNMKAHFTWSKVFDYFTEIGRSIIRSRSSEKTAYNRQVVDQINDYIMSHLNEDAGLVSLAEKYHFHPSYLARLYKHMTGITVGQYIVDVKLQHAKKMLATPDMQICDISRSLGFATAAYFGKFFKTHTSFTPSDYRRQVLKLE
jgi:two-component system, response regulator YesN